MDLIPEDFPRQITDASRASGGISESTGATLVGAVQCNEQPTTVAALPLAPSLSLPLQADAQPEAAMEYFMREYADILVKKADL